MLLSSHTFRISHDNPTLFAMVTNLRITQYPLFLTHNISKKLVFPTFHTPTNPSYTQSHSCFTLFIHTVLGHQFPFLIYSGERTKNPTWTLQTLNSLPTTFTYGIIIPIHRKQNIVNSLVRWKHTLLDFCFQKILEKRTLWLKSLSKQHPLFTTLWSC